MNLFRDLCLSLLPPIGVVILQIIRMNVLPNAMELDVAAHFLGGFAIAWGAAILWIRLRARKKIPATLPPWIIAWCLFGAVMFAGIAWEIFEFLMERYTHWLFQPSLADTMHDLVMDMIGGAVLISVAWKKIGRK